jgi:hypothetical protein
MWYMHVTVGAAVIGRCCHDIELIKHVTVNVDVPVSNLNVLARQANHAHDINQTVILGKFEHHDITSPGSCTSRYWQRYYNIAIAEGRRHSRAENRQQPWDCRAWANRQFGSGHDN